MRAFVDWLFRPFGPNHCEGAYLNERMRVNLPPELRGEVSQVAPRPIDDSPAKEAR